MNNSLTVSGLDVTGAQSHTTVMRLLADRAGRRLPLGAPPPHLLSPLPRAAAAVEAAASVTECTQPCCATQTPQSATHGEGAHDCTPIAGIQLLLYFPASTGIPPSLRAATPSPSESSDDGTAALHAAPAVGGD